MHAPRRRARVGCVIACRGLPTSASRSCPAYRRCTDLAERIASCVRLPIASSVQCHLSVSPVLSDVSPVVVPAVSTASRARSRAHCGGRHARSPTCTTIRVGPDSLIRRIGCDRGRVMPSRMPQCARRPCLRGVVFDEKSARRAGSGASRSRAGFGQSLGHLAPHVSGQSGSTRGQVFAQVHGNAAMAAAS